MRFTESIAKKIENLLVAPGEQLGRWVRFIRFQIQLGRFCVRRLRNINAMAMSAALSFRTIFALIPLLVIALLVARSVGVLNDSKKSLRTFLQSSGISEITLSEQNSAQPPNPLSNTGKNPTNTNKEPAQTPNTSNNPATNTNRVSAADKIIELVDTIENKLTFQKLGPIGAALLIWTALGLLTTIERSLNRIFEVGRNRALGRRMMMYWAVVTLVPVVLTVTSIVSQKALAIMEHMPLLSGILFLVGWLSPIIAGIIMLALVYMLMPNTRVSFRWAFFGASVAVPLWLFAKWGFGIYVHKLVGANHLYGNLGLLPLFLFWLNWSWLIFLLGALLCHTAANLGGMVSAEQAEKINLGPREMLAAAVAIAQPYFARQGPVALHELVKRLHLPQVSVQHLLEQLLSLKVICVAETGNEPAYIPAQPPEKVSVLDIVGITQPGDQSSPHSVHKNSISKPKSESPNDKNTNNNNTELGNNKFDPELEQIIDKFSRLSKKCLGSISLADLIN